MVNGFGAAAGGETSGAGCDVAVVSGPEGAPGPVASPGHSRSAMAVRARRAADTAVTISAAAPAPAATRRRFPGALRKPWSAFMFSVSGIPGNGAWAFDLFCNARPGQSAGRFIK